MATRVRAELLVNPDSRVEPVRTEVRDCRV